MLTARAATMPTVTNAEPDRSGMRSFAQLDSGIVPVGLNAVELVNDTNR